MSKILVINAGSSSVKFKVFARANLKEEQSGEFDIAQAEDSYQSSFKQILRNISGVGEISAVGHRFVHGGDKFTKPLLIDPVSLERLASLNTLAPLHNPYNLSGIHAAYTYLPNVPSVAVFDTAFFKNLPEKTKIYALPYKFYKEWGIKKFGFHGLSHQNAIARAAEQLSKPVSSLKLITCHLGGGCSIAAIDAGRPVDTSMGFTPLEGLVMQTRAGDLDPGILLHLLKNNDAQIDLEHVLNHESGIKGISGCDNFLELIKAVKLKQKTAELALDIFVNRLQKYIGAYAFILEKVDALVFTGKIGAGDALTRSRVNQLKNIKKIKQLVVEPNEELVIAGQVDKMI